VILVCDNLNTRKPAALYKAFTPEEARRLLACLEIHHTPKHGSWLNIAEIELVARNDNRNNAAAKIDWHFTTADARDSGLNVSMASIPLAMIKVY
jgi:hypothetical protein